MTWKLRRNYTIAYQQQAFINGNSTYVSGLSNRCVLKILETFCKIVEKFACIYFT